MTEQLQRRLSAVRASTARFYRNNSTLLLSAFTILSVLLIIWARLGFTFEIGRFYALEPEGEGAGQCAQEGDMHCIGNNVMLWSTDDIDGGCVDGLVETCTAPATCVEVGATASCVTPAAPSPTAEASPSPSAGPTCNNNGTCDAGESLEAGCEDCDLSQGRVLWAEFTDNNGGARISNTTYQDNREVSYCVYEMIDGSFTNQRLLAERTFIIGAAPPEKTLDVTLADVYSACGTYTLQLDLIRGGRACGEAPYHHEGYLFDAIIGLAYTKVCTSPSTPPTSPSTPPSTSTPPASFSCAPDSQSVEVGQTAQVTVSGGTAPFTWTAPGSSTLETSATTASVRYTTAGSYNVNVTDSVSRTDTCTVSVTTPPDRSRRPRRTNPDIEIVKLVRNVTLGIPERDIVAATPTNTVEFVLQVSSTGTGTARDVIVRDVLPDRLTYVPGSSRIDDIAAPDGIIGSGISLGDMREDTQKIVRFRATVFPASFFTYATTVLTNTGYADGSNVTEVSDIAHVSIEKVTPIIQPISRIKTGPGEALLAAFLISAIMTMLYVSYTHTSTYRRHEVKDIARQHDPLDFRS